MFLLHPAPRQESWEESDLFKPQPSSDVDAQGNKRYIGKSKYKKIGLKTLHMHEAFLVM